MQMRLGIQYLEELQVDNARDAGFTNFEVRYEDCTKEKLDNITGIVLKLDDLSEEIFYDALEKAKNSNAEYLMLDTVGVSDVKSLQDIVVKSAKQIEESDISIYIENGYKYQKNGDCCYSLFSEARELNRMVAEFNKLCGKECFGVCLNVGYANLIEKNVKVMVSELGDCIKVLHASDNDGKTDQHQMPCTFTTGRGIASTNWYDIIGPLVMRRKLEWIIFDTTGFVKRVPEKLQKTMLKFLWNMGQEWAEQFRMDEVLNQPEKKIILFGAGKMAQNYMESWGEKYPPAFFVDNSSKAWGQKAFGFEIKPPNAILEIPEQERSVWICNQYYDAVGRQLRDMGVEYRCFWDQYYLNL